MTTSVPFKGRMSSLFSSRSKMDLRSSGSLNKAVRTIEHLSGLFGDSKNASCEPSASKIRKRKPPPITICLESGNILFTTAQPIPATYPNATPVTPANPAFPQSLSPNTASVLLEPPVSFSQLKTTRERQHSHDVPILQLPTRGNPYVELPGSLYFPKSTIDVEPANTPRRSGTSEKANNPPWDSTPCLTPASLCERPRIKVDELGSPLRENAGRHQDEDDLIDWMKNNIGGESNVTTRRRRRKDAPLGIIVLDAEDIQWNKDIQRSCSLSGASQKGSNQTEGNVMPIPRWTEEATKEIHDPRMATKVHDRKPCLISPNSQSTGTKDTIFHSNGVQPPLANYSQTTNHQATSQTSRMTGNCSDPDRSHSSDWAFYTSEVAALKFRVVELEYINATMEGKLRQYRREIRLFKKDVKGYKKDEKYYTQALEDKDAEISSLHEKVAQLVSQSSSTASGSTSISSFVLKDLDKELPSPRPPVEAIMSGGLGSRSRAASQTENAESIAAKTHHRRFWV